MSYGRLWRVVLALCCSLWLAPMPSFASGQALLAGAEGTRAQDVTPHWFYLQDAGAALTLAQAQQAFDGGQFASAQGTNTALGFGFTPSAYWLRLVVRNPADHASTQMLEVANPQISSVDFYVPEAGGAYKVTRSGGNQPFSSRPFANRYLVLPIELPAQADKVIYLRVKSDLSLIVPALLWPEADFVHHVRNEYTVQGWYFGIAVAMLLFNLLLFVALRERIYLLYVAYVSCALLTIAAKNGMAAEFLWSDVLQWGNFSYYAGGSLSLVALIAFSRQMLTTATSVPKMDSVLKGLMVVHLFAPVVYWFAIGAVAPMVIVLAFLSAVLLMGLGVWCAFKGMRSAYFYVGTFVMLFVGGVMTLMRSLGWLPTNAFTVDGLQMGSSLEMLLLAFALADRFNVLRREKLHAQQELLATQRTMVETLQESERTLIQRVDERTQELQALNEKLEALALVDGLTNIPNRRQFDQVLQKEWGRMLRQEQPLAVLMFDVDWFKRFNDQYGHQAGDQCLQAVASAIAKLGRGSDLVARYGGEEFVMVAPVTDGESAMLLARRACDAVQALALVHGGSDNGVVTISVGVAAQVPAQGHSVEELLRAADQALYQAKAGGRNQAALVGDL